MGRVDKVDALEIICGARILPDPARPAVADNLVLLSFAEADALAAVGGGPGLAQRGRGGGAEGGGGGAGASGRGIPTPGDGVSEQTGKAAEPGEAQGGVFAAYGPGVISDAALVRRVEAALARVRDELGPGPLAVA